MTTTMPSHMLGNFVPVPDDLAALPAARIHLPRRVPAGFHGNWLPDVE
jgi:carotenoid cleavage dioxygenase-like enzyme